MDVSMKCQVSCRASAARKVPAKHAPIITAMKRLPSRLATSAIQAMIRTVWNYLTLHRHQLSATTLWIHAKPSLPLQAKLCEVVLMTCGACHQITIRNVKIIIATAVSIRRIDESVISAAELDVQRSFLRQAATTNTVKTLL